MKIRNEIVKMTFSVSQRNVSGYTKEEVRARYKNGKLHRENGPATLDEDGSKTWYKNGEIHREDGPAIIFANGTKMWYKEGKLHREHGPAIIYNNGVTTWCKNGVTTWCKNSEHFNFKN